MEHLQEARLGICLHTMHNAMLTTRGTSNLQPKGPHGKGLQLANANAPKS